MYYIVVDEYFFIFGIYENKNDIIEGEKYITVNEELYGYILSNMGRKKLNYIDYNKIYTIEDKEYFEFINVIEDVATKTLEERISELEKENLELKKAIYKE